MNDIITFKVFVYGTLKKGLHNHSLIKHSKFLGEYNTGPGFTKIVRGLPYLIKDDEGIGCSGEVYEVSKLTLDMLDRLEGHPNWYERTIIKVTSDEDKELPVWCYLMDKERI